MKITRIERKDKKMRCPYCQFEVSVDPGCSSRMAEHNSKEHDGKQPVPEDYGELMTATEFSEVVLCGGFIDYDGSGYYSDGVFMYRERPALPSAILRAEGRTDPKYSHVAWFNK